MMRFLVLLLIAGLAGLSFYQYQKIDGMDNEIHILRTTLQDTQKAQSDLQNQLNQQKNQTAGDHAALEKQKQDQLRQLASLRAQAMLEEQRLAALKQNLSHLEEQKKSGSPGELDANLRRDQGLLKDIENRIRSYDLAKKEVNQNSRQALKVRQADEKNQLQQINDSLKLQNQQIRQTQQDIKFWQKKKRDPNQNDRLDELGTQLQAQQNNLVTLQAQKKEVADQLAQNTVAINAESSAERDELQSTQGQLQSQALNVRSELQYLQGQKDRGQKETQGLGQQIQSLRGQIDATNARLKTLDDQIGTLEKAVAPPAQ
jgi:chromosome segregation ATPase